MVWRKRINPLRPQKSQERGTRSAIGVFDNPFLNTHLETQTFHRARRTFPGCAPSSRTMPLRQTLVITLLIEALLLPAPLRAQSQAPAPDITVGDIDRALPTFVRAQIERRHIAGAVVVVVKDGAVLLEQGFGLAGVAARRSMDRLTPMRIGSVTKLFTALAVMQLVDEGRVSLDDDVTRYLDFALPVASDRPVVTLRRLLSHQAGFADRIGGIGTSGVPIELGRFLHTRTQPRLRQKDDVVAYSNYNAALAARVVERVSGEPFDVYLAKRVFEPLGMGRTTAVQPAPSSLQTSFGYVRADAPPTRVSMAADAIMEVGSTGVVAPAADMTRLLLALLETTPRIVSRTALDQMMTAQTRVPLGFMGLGMYSPLGMGGNPFVGHDGGTGAFQSVVALLPHARFGLFASYNSDGIPEPLTPTAELLQLVATRYFPRERIAGGPPRAIAGTYAPTRRVDTSLFRLRLLLQQLSVGSTPDGLTIRPALLPIAQPLTTVAPGLYTWADRDVAFTGSGGEALMQVGAPPGLFRRIPWWENAGWVVPAIAIGLLVSVASLLIWPVAIVRGRYRDPSARRPHITIRVALLLYLTAWTLGLWMVFAWWPEVALSSPAVAPITISMYAAAWTAVILTLVAIWQAITAAREPRSVWTAGEKRSILWFSSCWLFSASTGASRAPLSPCN